jgi:hypothetical protein
VVTTFPQYINNPAGMKNAVISHREMYRQLYSAKLDTIYLRENGKIDFVVYKSGNDYIIHMKIPSEKIEDFYYDVVLQFSPSGLGKDLSTSIKDYGVRFFSNDPSFMYTFTHAFHKNDLLIKDLMPKISKTALKKNADERNPDNQVGYVKSFYFAYLIMENKSLFSKIRLDSMSNPYDKKKLLADVEDQETKVSERESAKPKKKPKKSEEELPDEEVRKPGVSPVSNKAKPTTRVTTTPKTARVGKTKRTKRI